VQSTFYHRKINFALDKDREDIYTCNYFIKQHFYKIRSRALCRIHYHVLVYFSCSSGQ